MWCIDDIITYEEDQHSRDNTWRDHLTQEVHHWDMMQRHNQSPEEKPDHIRIYLIIYYLYWAVSPAGMLREKVHKLHKLIG